MDLDFAIVAEIAGMIAISNPTLKPSSSISQTRATATTQATIPSGYNTPEHAKYKGIDWGAVAAQSSGQYTTPTQPAVQPPTHRSLSQADLDSELASLPAALRNVVRSVAIRPGCDAGDCNTMASTVGGTGIIDVWSGSDYIPSLGHEAAHLLAWQKYRNYIPPGYQEVWQAEGGVSEYGSTSAREDFAEAVQHYVDSKPLSERKRAIVQKALNE